LFNGQRVLLCRCALPEAQGAQGTQSTQSSDEALNMLFSMPDIAGLELRVVDVVSDDELLAAYGERLPVLQLFATPDAEAPDASADANAEAIGAGPELVLELGWPFTPDSIGDALRML